MVVAFAFVIVVSFVVPFAALVDVGVAATVFGATVVVSTTLTVDESTLRLKLLLELLTAVTKVSATSSALGIGSSDAVLLNSIPISASVLIVLCPVVAALNATTKERMKRIPYLRL